MVPVDTQIATISYCIRGLKDMPGRKSLILMTSRSTYVASSADPSSLSHDYHLLLFNELADEALRKGIVIHTLDMKGLNVSENYPIGYNEKYLPLSQKTGGILVDNSNFFINGIGPAAEEMKGYYLLAYKPPADTFAFKDGQLYHRIRIKVKRRGCTVRTRDGFFGLPDPPDLSAAAGRNPLRQAIFSPYLYNDLNVNLASGYTYASGTGYFIRSWMSLEAKDLTFIDEQNGGHSVSLEAVVLTADGNGGVRDSSGVRYDYYVKNDDLPRVKKGGIDFELYLPVRYPGSYFVRAAIRDRASGKIGTAYQFLEIPNLTKRRLAISSIFIADKDDDLSSIRSGDIKGSKGSFESARVLREVPRSPALRYYPRGSNVEYLAIVFNAKSKNGLEPRLVSHYVLYKDGNEYSKRDLGAVILEGTVDFERIPVVNSLVLGKEMEEGKYVLQLSIIDKSAGEKSQSAVQAIDFEVLGQAGEDSPDSPEFH